MSVGVGVVQGASHTLRLQHNGGRERGTASLKCSEPWGWWWCLRSETKGGAWVNPRHDAELSRTALESLVKVRQRAAKSETELAAQQKLAGRRARHRFRCTRVKNQAQG
jgi:hypothetical protein